MGFPNHTPVSNVFKVQANTSPITIVPENHDRRGVTIFNDSSAILYIKLGSNITSDDFSLRLPSYAYYESPYGYSGIITGYWASTNGYARMTEIS